MLKRKTAASRFTRAVRTISQWCRQHRHDPIEEQHAVLCQKLRGHAGYYGIVGNSPSLSRFYHEVLKVWRKWLMRRRRAWRSCMGLVSPAPETLPCAVPANSPYYVPRRSEWII